MTFSPASTLTPDPRSDKQPRIALNGDREHSATVFAFPPNRDTLGGTAYLIQDNSSDTNILIDSPAWNEANRSFLSQGIQWLVLTHRDSIGRAIDIQQALGCQILIHEQEAYLLPGANLTTFQTSFALTPQVRMLWTPGHSPGSACLYHSQHGGVLFTGRHLLPSPQAPLLPIRTAKTFHWRRQIQSVQRLIDEFTPETLSYICPGANLGFLRGKYAIDQAFERLQQSLIQTNDRTTAT